MAATVWIVDDEESVRDVLGAMMDEIGFSARLFADPRDALAAYHRGAADAVITDVRMPEMSGLELTKALLAKDPDAVVIILTGYPSVSDAVEIIKAGASDYLTKPFRLEEIRMRIGRAVQNRELQASFRRNRILTWVLIGSLPLWFLLGIILVRCAR
jgi:DNA-binding NtrC family response regulator